MKKLALILLVIFVSLVFESCNNNSADSGVKLKSMNDQIAVDGDAGNYIELIDKEITLKQIESPTREKEGNWGTSIKFKVIKQTDEWLSDMVLTFLDESGKEIYDFESTMTHDALTRNGLLTKINEGSGFYEVKFQNFIGSIILDSKEDAALKVKKFNDNIGKAKFFKVLGKMEPNPNK